mmetsp:Transcript_113410/g.169628  ORF Transcript_113410/g.169628 Transcript_113410/m.169628 type:complete len:105 (+) Transcript_113410:440-754(+)
MCGSFNQGATGGPSPSFVKLDHLLANVDYGFPAGKRNGYVSIKYSHFVMPPHLLYTARASLKYVFAVSSSPFSRKYSPALSLARACCMMYPPSLESDIADVYFE